MNLLNTCAAYLSAVYHTVRENRSHETDPFRAVDCPNPDMHPAPYGFPPPIAQYIKIGWSYLEDHCHTYFYLEELLLMELEGFLLFETLSQEEIQCIAMVKNVLLAIKWEFVDSQKEEQPPLQGRRYPLDDLWKTTDPGSLATEDRKDDRGWASSYYELGGIPIGGRTTHRFRDMRTINSCGYLLSRAYIETKRYGLPKLEPRFDSVFPLPYPVRRFLMSGIEILKCAYPPVYLKQLFDVEIYSLMQYARLSREEIMCCIMIRDALPHLQDQDPSKLEEVLYGCTGRSVCNHYLYWPDTRELPQEHGGWGNPSPEAWAAPKSQEPLYGNPLLGGMGLTASVVMKEKLDSSEKDSISISIPIYKRNPLPPGCEKQDGEKEP